VILVAGLVTGHAFGIHACLPVVAGTVVRGSPAVFQSLAHAVAINRFRDALAVVTGHSGIAFAVGRACVAVFMIRVAASVSAIRQRADALSRFIASVAGRQRVGIAARMARGLDPDSAVAKIAKRLGASGFVRQKVSALLVRGASRDGLDIGGGDGVGCSGSVVEPRNRRVLAGEQQGGGERQEPGGLDETNVDSGCPHDLLRVWRRTGNPAGTEDLSCRGPLMFQSGYCL